MKWLVRRFVRNAQNTQDQSVRAAYGTLGALVGITLNLLLAVMKMLVGLTTGSVAVMADGVNNLSDAGGSVVALASVRMAQKPTDREHPFGHGRIEYIGALAVGVLIAVFGIELMKTGVENILHSEAIRFSPVSIALMTAGILVKLWMWRFYNYIGKTTNNPAMTAAGQDSLSDVMATGAVVLSMMVTLAFGWPVDGYVGVAVALLVLRAAWSVLKDTVTKLLGGAPDKEKGTQILDMLLSYPQILGAHDFVLHDYGPGRCMASVHAEVAADADFIAVHEVVDRAEREISEKFGVPICIHMDPVMTGDAETNRVQASIQKYLSSLTPPLKLHDFRRVPGENCINLVFDVVLPSCEHEESALRDGICAYARTLDERYHCVVHFDRDYFTYAVDEEMSREAARSKRLEEEADMKQK